MAYMVAAYLIIWAASFVFIFSIMQHQRSLQHEIDALKELMQAQSEER